MSWRAHVNPCKGASIQVCKHYKLEDIKKVTQLRPRRLPKDKVPLVLDVLRALKPNRDHSVAQSWSWQ